MTRISDEEVKVSLMKKRLRLLKFRGKILFIHKYSRAKGEPDRILSINRSENTIINAESTYWFCWMDSPIKKLYGTIYPVCLSRKMNGVELAWCCWMTKQENAYDATLTIASHLFLFGNFSLKLK